MRGLLFRIRHLLQRQQFDDDLAEEMAFHRALKQRDLEEGGQPPEQSAFAARRALGSQALAQDQAREARIWPWLADSVRDVRHAARLLRRKPGIHRRRRVDPRARHRRQHRDLQPDQRPAAVSAAPSRTAGAAILRQRAARVHRHRRRDDVWHQQADNEFGVRMALGAERRHVLWLVLGETARLGAAGVLSGLLPAMAAGRFVSSLLFGLTPYDPLAIGAAAAMMIAVALLAGYLPALRATRIDPLLALRRE